MPVNTRNVERPTQPIPRTQQRCSDGAAHELVADRDIVRPRQNGRHLVWRRGCHQWVATKPGVATRRGGD